VYFGSAANANSVAKTLLSVSGVKAARVSLEDERAAVVGTVPLKALVNSVKVRQLYARFP
jgi:hypothetical protein